jgi:glutamyl-tRNA(Gln) amidotransferase subunit E
VAHTKWIPELTHNECFRQWALLHIKELLNKKIPKPSEWRIQHIDLGAYPFNTFKCSYKPLLEARKLNYGMMAINLPNFRGILSHFMQPGKIFADEISDRLKVIACIEKPHMVHSEQLHKDMASDEWAQFIEMFEASENDAQLVIWGPQEDMETALETIEERCQLAFERVPNETRKSFEDGTTMFERVLPGADRMYPDTDTPPIPLEDVHIEAIRKNLPAEVIERYHQLKKWGVPEDTYTYLFKKNFFPLILRIVDELKLDPKTIGTFFGHRLKFVEGHYIPAEEFNYKIIFAMFRFLVREKLDIRLVNKMLPVVYEHPKMDFDSVLTSIGFKKVSKEKIRSHIPFLKEKFRDIRQSGNDEKERNWIMGELREIAIGNMDLKDLSEMIGSS